MVKRSLKASSQGIAIAKRSFERTGWTQDYLAAEVGLSTRQSIWKFFAGRTLDRHVFTEICFALNLDWQEIADLPTFQDDKENSSDAPAAIATLTEPSPDLTSRDTTPPDPTFPSIQPIAENFVATFKPHLAGLIQSQCAFMQSSFEVPHPQQLENFYTPTYVLPTLSRQQWLEVSDLLPASGRPQLNPAAAEVIPALDLVQQRSKVVILGKPGAGKTTFLQHLALGCQGDRIFAERLPVFIRLHRLEQQAPAEGKFPPLQWIVQQWRSLPITPQEIDTLLRQGKILLLLDGIDEVSKPFQDQIFSDLQQFAETYFQTAIVITNRIAAQDFYLRGFYSVEISDFRPSQIQSFAQQWFAEVNPQPAIGQQRAQQFLHALDQKQNESIRDLAVTPILLSLLCAIFQQRSSFPTQREKIYQVGLDILLVRWDQSRGIQRDDPYHNLSLSEKINLLSQIAATTFQKRQYFFEKSVVIQIIYHYLQSSFPATHGAEERRLTCEAVLSSIERQHGLLVERAKDIYSFSHLTFQEYLTARYLVSQSLADPSQGVLRQIATQIHNPDWREVIRLVTTLLPEPALFLALLKAEIDQRFADDPDFQNGLNWVARQGESLAIPCHPAALRAFYLSLFHNRQLDLAIALDEQLTNPLPPALAIDLALARLWQMGQEMIGQFSLKSLLNLVIALDVDRNFPISVELAQDLKQLKEDLPNARMGKESLQLWWQAFGEDWVTQLQQAILHHRYLETEASFRPPSSPQLESYLQTNQFFLDCARHTPLLSAEDLDRFQLTLLLPVESSS